MKFQEVVLILVLLGAAIAPPVFAETLITFLSDRSGDGYSTFAMNPDGSNVIDFSKEIGLFYGFSYSPDKTKILFESKRRRPGNWEIFVINADLSNGVNLTNHTAADRFPRWSPDGTKIVWGRFDGNSENVFVMNADGSNQRDLGPGISPRWSPDGTKIAYYDNDLGFNTFIVNADGSGWFRLTDVFFGRNRARFGPLGFVQTFFRCWSPDGKRVAFAATFEPALLPRREHLYGVKVDGSDLVDIAKDVKSGSYRHASWSPDGAKIAFQSDGEIFVVNADGSDPVNLTKRHGRFASGVPEWSPDGGKILFGSEGEIYTMNADGSNPVNLTNHPAHEFLGRWARYNSHPQSVTPKEKLPTTWGQLKHETR